MSEIWLPVPGFEGSYEVSNEGRFRSLDRTVHFADGRVRKYHGQVLKLKINRDGYPLVNLANGTAAKRWRLAHSVVAETFLGEKPEGHEVCHNDGRPGNLRAENLRYAPRWVNHSDKMLHGTAVYGAAHPCAKLSEADIAAIRNASGTVTAIADKFGVSRTHVWNIRKGLRRNSLSELIS